MYLKRWKRKADRANLSGKAHQIIIESISIDYWTWRHLDPTLIFFCRVLDKHLNPRVEISPSPTITRNWLFWISINKFTWFGVWIWVPRLGNTFKPHGINTSFAILAFDRCDTRSFAFDEVIRHSTGTLLATEQEIH